MCYICFYRKGNEESEGTVAYLKDKLQTVESLLHATRAEQKTTETELQTELRAVKRELQATRVEQKITKTELRAVKRELQATKEEHLAARTERQTTNEEYAELARNIGNPFSCCLVGGLIVVST